MSHELYQPADFNQDERERRNALYVYVVEGGLGVCKRCGAAESELDDYPTCQDYETAKRIRREELKAHISNPAVTVTPKKHTPLIRRDQSGWMP